MSGARGERRHGADHGAGRALHVVSSQGRNRDGHTKHTNTAWNPLHRIRRNPAQGRHGFHHHGLPFLRSREPTEIVGGRTARRNAPNSNLRETHTGRGGHRFHHHGLLLLRLRSAAARVGVRFSRRSNTHANHTPHTEPAAWVGPGFHPENANHSPPIESAAWVGPGFHPENANHTPPIEPAAWEGPGFHPDAPQNENASQHAQGKGRQVKHSIPNTKHTHTEPAAWVGPVVPHETERTENKLDIQMHEKIGMGGSILLGAGIHAHGRERDPGSGEPQPQPRPAQGEAEVVPYSASYAWYRGGRRRLVKQHFPTQPAEKKVYAGDAVISAGILKQKTIEKYKEQILLPSVLSLRGGAKARKKNKKRNKNLSWVASARHDRCRVCDPPERNQTRKMWDMIGCPYGHVSSKVSSDGSGFSRRYYKCGICQVRFSQKPPLIVRQEGFKNRNAEIAKIKTSKYKWTAPAGARDTEKIRSHIGDVTFEFHNSSGLKDRGKRAAYLRAGTNRAHVRFLCETSLDLTRTCTCTSLALTPHLPYT